MKATLCLWALAVSLIFQAHAESNTTNILDGVTTNVAGPFTLGDTGPFNFLLITNGGRLTNTAGTVGNGVGAHDNQAVISGAGSRWENSMGLRVGVEGSSNSMLVLESGRVKSASGQVGEARSSSGNLVTLAGTGSAWETMSGGPNIGGEGSWNRFEISGGAWATGLRGGVGWRTNAAHNLALVTGAGSVWTNSGRFHIGGQGSFNRMIVSNGGFFNGASAPTPIGDHVTAKSNSVVVTGPGSLWMSQELLIGTSGSFNRLIASDGARIESGRAAVGESCVASGNLALITGVGTVWSNGLLEVGFCSTNNHLVVSNSAQVFAGLVRSSVQGGASNSFTVTGPGSLLRAAGDLIVGNSGTATMSFQCVDGKEYRVWSSNDLEMWTEVSDPTFAYPSPGRCEWTDDGKDTGGVGAASRFYRVTVE